jgi:hypothetical protein
MKFEATKKVWQQIFFFTPVIREYLREFSKKFETAPKGILNSLARGTLIHEKTW